MAAITINDTPFIPQVVEEWVNEDLVKKSEILTSRAVVTGFTDVPKNGYKIQMPIWGGIDGLAQARENCLVPGGLKSALVDVQIQRTGKALSVQSIIEDISGHDPLDGIVNKLSSFWSRQIQNDLVASLTGSSKAIDALNPGTVITAAALPAGHGAIVAGLELFGEQMDDEYVLVMHPSVYAALLNKEPTLALPASETRRFRSYLGMQVIVDKSAAPVAGEYPIYLLHVGAFRYGTYDLGFRSMESDRDILCDEDTLTVRKDYMIAPNGASFVGTPAIRSFATPAEFANAANWELGATEVEAYRIRVAKVTLA